jgi:hypothetical protein
MTVQHDLTRVLAAGTHSSSAGPFPAFQVVDRALAEWGRNEIRLAEHYH